MSGLSSSPATRNLFTGPSGGTSSTEAKLVGVINSMPFNMWATYFFKAQGQDVTDYKLGIQNILYQDNESCIKLANNGKASSTKRTRHINI